MELAEQVKISALVVSCLGLWATAYQIRRSRKQRASERIADLMKALHNDPLVRDGYYLIEYSKFKYDEFFHDSEEEKQIDALITVFEQAAREWEAGLLSTKDVKMLSYEYLMTYQNPEIQNYLKFLQEWAERRGLVRAPWSSFERLGERLEKRYFKNPRGLTKRRSQSMTSP